MVTCSKANSCYFDWRLKEMKLSFLLVFLLMIAFFAPIQNQAEASQKNIHEIIESIPVQEAGRIKPYQTFARESLQLIHGKTVYEKRQAEEILFTWMLIPEHWNSVPIFEVKLFSLKEALGLPASEKYFSFAELISNPKVPVVFQELKVRRERQEKLNPFFQAVQRLESQINLFSAIQNGQALKVLPAEDGNWKSLSELSDEERAHFTPITMSFVKAIGGDTSELEQATEKWKDYVDQKISGFPSASSHSQYKISVQREILYNTIHPFRWAWVFYLIALLIFLTSADGKWVRLSAWSFMGMGALLHVTGMVLRSLIMERPPVSNMFETIIWVPWGALLFSLIIYRSIRNKAILIGALAIAILCLILSDIAPAVLDPSLQPLEPVLRSNFWLTTHVLMITISYAAFFLAFVLGDWSLIQHLRKKNSENIEALSQAIYRCLQIGVVLLAAGIILGGIWADYSWGRFWGWDPKETWALVALLGYIAVLHARLVGWVTSFGLAVSVVIAFSLVIMAWYGVNFVLGAGLHSYGFGAGGVEYVSAFVLAHILFVIHVTTVRYLRKRSIS